MNQNESPENLNKYIKVEYPAGWMILGAVILLMTGIIVWGIFGRVQDRLGVTAVSDGETLVCYVPEANISSIEEGTQVLIDEQEFAVKRIDPDPIRISETDNAYVLHVSGLENEQWVFRIIIDGTIAEGVYAAEITTETAAPMSFIFG